MGIQSTSAMKASILVQLTSVFVPIIESLTGERVFTWRLWLSSLCAFFSVVLISTSGDGIDSFEGLLNFRSGDALVILSSIFYSMHVIRLEKYAQGIDPISLARSKAFSELLLSLFTVFVCVTLLGQSDIVMYIAGLTNSGSRRVIQIRKCRYYRFQRI